MNHKRFQRGISLVETVVSLALLTFVIGSTLATVGPVIEGSVHAERSLHAARLGDELLREILAQSYEDPDVVTKAIGTDAGESYGDRSTFDDVDDYASYIAAPAEDRSGKARSGSSDYTQYVDVDWVDPMTFKTASSETGLKIIRVIVYHDKTLLFDVESVVSQGNAKEVGK